MAMLNGMATEMRPIICMGGWMNMPKWMSSGFIPCPSSGAIVRRSSGLARKTMTPRKKAMTRAMTPVAYGAVYGSFRGQAHHGYRGEEGIDRRDEQERTRVAGVEGDPGVDLREGETAVLGHVADGEVVGDECVDQRQRRDREQQRHGHHAVARAQHENGRLESRRRGRRRPSRIPRRRGLWAERRIRRQPATASPGSRLSSAPDGRSPSESDARAASMRQK